jgi:hypothetical protein
MTNTPDNLAAREVSGRPIIAAAPGTTASYHRNLYDGEGCEFAVVSVIAWDKNGFPLVIGSDGQLIQAHSYGPADDEGPNFELCSVRPPDLEGLDDLDDLDAD